MLNSILEATGQNPIKNKSARAFSERWLKAKIVGLAESSVFSYKLALRLFLEHLGSMADKPSRAVRPEQIETFKTARIATGLSAKTVDRDRKVLRSIFRSGIKQGLLNFDPSQTVSLVSKKKNAGAQTISREVIRPKELDAILNTTTGDWRTATFLGRYTGARLSDCVSMRGEISTLPLELSITSTEKLARGMSCRCIVVCEITSPLFRTQRKQINAYAHRWTGEALAARRGCPGNS